MIIQDIKKKEYLILEKSGIKIEGYKDNSILHFELDQPEQIFGFRKEFDTTINQIPNNISIILFENETAEEYNFTNIFRLSAIEKIDDILRVSVSSWGDDLLHIDYKDYVYYRTMILEAQTLSSPPIIEYLEEKGVEDCSSLSMVFKFKNEKESIKSILEEELKPLLENLEKIVDLQINDFKWNLDYEKNEKLFSQDLLQPLFSKMGFDKVIYNHGTKEFGKDFILSRINEFGIEDFYGVQVKAGGVSGKVNSQIDELIGQCDDTFKIPWKDIKRNEYPISKLIIAISGNFSENAKEKIKYKINDVIKSNIIFLDKDLIISLNRKHLKK
ncbi:hypothetical protein [uncultured Kriegella sp.]|uniref:restriction endonuclease n=1 Tax=uncultured Kriegella sp. TaxID=1798910 RepID=UPI0030D8495B|tara:strand:- start:303245 stop:304231 length:987 start_codon:yes stop_codon:yes gene_type:complete